MSMPSRSSLRRIGALVIIPMIMLLGACGMKTDLKIHDDKVDMTIFMWDSTDRLTEDSCSESSGSQTDIPEGSKVTYNFTEHDSKHDGHPSCEMKATDIPVSQFDGKGGKGGQSGPSGGSIKITHENGHYDVTVPLNDTSDSDQQEMKQAGVEFSVSITFPGRVTEASGNAEKKGNTVIWAKVLDEKGSLHAVGEDSAGLFGVPWLWIIVGGAVVLVVILVVVILVAKSGKKKKPAAPGAPGGYPGQPMGYPQPGQQPYNPQQQPGYPQQGAQPGYPQQQPGYPQQHPGQPGQNPQQPYNPNGQPGQQPYNPNGQY